ncbi:MAG: cation transporter [Gammaproteobacteria bacterium]|nr:cation transporter [Gammaproteobacteria bacterium]
MRDTLAPIEGVYRVDLYPRQRKLSVRFIEGICAFDSLMEALRSLGDPANPSTGPHACCGAEADNNSPGTAATASQTAERRGGTALSFLMRRPTARSGMIGPIKESTLIEFFNDALVLFLIKLHWHMITQHWLRQPWRYRYEWMAAIYLIYLLVRSRRPRT